MAVGEYERVITGQILLEKRYELGGELACGAMGRVFRARDHLLARDVAVKLIRLDGVEAADHAAVLASFEREALAIARLNHPNIVTIYSFGAWSGLPYLVLELSDGHSLAALVAQGPLPLARTVDILEQILLGLAHAHRLGVLHRDLKPQNVFVRSDGVVKILDFGLSSQGWRAVRSSDSAAASRTTVLGAGTPAYMAPEQWHSGRQDERTDLWAVGVIAHEMLTGLLPANGSSGPATLRIIPGFDAIVKRAIAPEPVDRFRDASDMLTALVPFRSGASAASRLRARITASVAATVIVVAAAAGAQTLCQHPLDVAAATSLYGVRPDSEAGNATVAQERGRAPHAITIAVDIGGHVRAASTEGETWVWWDAGGPVGWKGRFATTVELAAHAATLVRSFGIAIDGRLHEYASAGTAWVWRDRGGPATLIGSPSTTTYIDDDGSSRTRVFALGGDSNLYEYDGRDGTWRNHGGQGKLFGSPTVMSSIEPAGRWIRIFVVDAAGDLHERLCDGNSWTWIDHHSPAILAGSVSVASYLYDGARRINVFAIGSDGHLYELWWNRRSWHWSDMGGPGDLVGSPSSVTYINRDHVRRLHVFALGADGHLHEFSWNGDDWVWADKGRPDSDLIGSPSAIAYHEPDGRLHLDVVATDRRGWLHDLTWAAAGWSWGDPGGGALAPMRR